MPLYIIICIECLNKRSTIVTLSKWGKNEVRKCRCLLDILEATKNILSYCYKTNNTKAPQQCADFLAQSYTSHPIWVRDLFFHLFLSMHFFKVLCYVLFWNGNKDMFIVCILFMKLIVRFYLNTSKKVKCHELYKAGWWPL